MRTAFDRAHKLLGIGSTLLTGFMFVYFAISSYGRGEELGPFVSFMGMLIWAQVQSDYQKALNIAQEALAGWSRALDMADGE